MENAAEQPQVYAKARKKRGGGRLCVAIIRWVFILLFAVVLLGGLYFKAPWKILVLDGLLLALLTVVPKQKRKYGWLTLAAAVLAVTVWIFIPEKDTGDWRPYTFDKELAALEAKRMVPPEADAAPLYEDLLQRWKQIEENDPFPEEADDDCVTQSRPWTAEEFPEVAVWFERHEDFFGDLIAATQKPACCFPAAVTSFELSESMERLSPIRRFCLHLSRASYLDMGEKRNIKEPLEKQIAILNLGKHINQQPLLIDMLVGVAAEAVGYAALEITLMQESFLKEASFDDIISINEEIQNSHFDHQQKWRQAIAYEKLLAKNCYGMCYEVNSEGMIRFARGKALIDLINQGWPEEDRVYSYWDRVCGRFSIIITWLSNFPENPTVISKWFDEAYHRLDKDFQSEDGFEKIDGQDEMSFELNWKYFISQITQMEQHSFYHIRRKILPRIRTQKNGAELICDLAIFKKQQGRFPNTLEELWLWEESKTNALETYSGFIYEKTNDNFKLYHVGLNGIDEQGYYKFPEFDPNEVNFQDLKPESDDILIWPDELEGSD